MTSKQCNSCKWLHIWRDKGHEDTCFLVNTEKYMIELGCELP